MFVSLLGVTSLIFISKGYVFGQVLTVFFALLYGVVSYFCRYYGEMITFMGMSGPVAVCSIVSWLRHPYAGTKEVQVSRQAGLAVGWGGFAGYGWFLLYPRRIGQRQLGCQHAFRYSQLCGF